MTTHNNIGILLSLMYMYTMHISALGKSKMLHSLGNDLYQHLAPPFSAMFNSNVPHSNECLSSYGTSGIKDFAKQQYTLSNTRKTIVHALQYCTVQQLSFILHVKNEAECTLGTVGWVAYSTKDSTCQKGGRMNAHQVLLDWRHTAQRIATSNTYTMAYAPK